MPIAMLTPSPAAVAPTSATRGTSPVPSGFPSNSSSHHHSHSSPHAGGVGTLDPDGYMCSVCGYSVLHSHPQLLIECHYCAQWFHRACVHISERDATQIVKYACYSCSSGKQNGSSSSNNGGPVASSYLAAPAQYAGDFSRYLSDKGSSGSSNGGRHGAGIALYKKNSDEFRHVLKTGYFSKSGVRVLQPQVSFELSCRSALRVSTWTLLGVHMACQLQTDQLLVLLLFPCCLPLQDFTSSYFRDYPSACEEPTLVEGSNWREPLPAFGASEIAALLASSCAMRSVDVESQESFNLSATGWSARLADAKTTPVNAHFRVQDTSYRSVVVAPGAVAEVDWHLALPSASGSSPSSSPSSSSASPSAQQGASGSVNPDTFGSFFGAGSFQDFAISRGGKSSWISVSDGDAWVFLVAPTHENYRSFEDWKCTVEPAPARVFLAERVDHCIRCVVSKNSTLFVPAGWMFAIYSERGCSFFSGFFSMTASLSAQMRVLEMEASAHLAPHLAQSSLTAGWPLLDAAPQVWAAVCFYVRQYLIPDPSVIVGEMDKHALLRALPYLRRWSSFPKALKATNSVTWMPSSLSEAQGILDRLEQSLSNALSVSSMRSPYDQQRFSSLPVMGHGRQEHHLSVSEADYLYSRGGDVSADPSMSWPMTDSNGPGSVQPVSGFQDMPAMWNYESPEHSHSAAGVGGFYHSDMVGAGEFSSHVGTNFTFSLPTQGGSGGFPVAPMGSGSDSYMDAMRQQLLGPALVAPSPGMQHHHQSAPSHHAHYDSGSLYGQPDVLVRHRASCHRCGNLRKKNVRCPQCPHIFCQKCAEKMLEEHGENIFVDGCPVCKEQCCCGKNRTILCTRKFHCYKKCPSTKKPSV